MIIYGAIGISLITIAILFCFFREKVVWWEPLVLLIATIGFVVGAKAAVGYIQCSDTEYWGGYITKAEYYEDWNELVHYTVTVCTGTGKTRSCHTEMRTRVDYHPEYWEVTDSNSISNHISKDKFNWYATRFGNKKFVDLHRSHHTNDGDKYVSTWPGTDDTLDESTSTHSYQNKVANSNSVFKFKKVDPKTYGLFNYPNLSGYQTANILGLKTKDPQAEHLVDILNGRQGSVSQVYIWILLFYDKPQEAGFEQENYWEGGNKNEFVVTIGLSKKDNTVQWVHVFSWTKVEALKVDTRNYLLEQPTLDLPTFVKWLYPQIARKWKRREFKEFNYLTVEPKPWATITVYILTIVINIGVAVWVIGNEFDPDGTNTRNTRSRYYR